MIFLFLIASILEKSFADNILSDKIPSHTFDTKRRRDPSSVHKKEYYSCKDALLNATTFNDAALNMMWTYVYTICTMELGLQSYVQRIKKQNKKTERDLILLEKAQNTLTRTQKVVSAYLAAFQCAIVEFTSGGLRQTLDTLKLEMMRKLDGNTEKKLVK